ncbi:hypothetical protein ABW21_db0206814 [Orbilia brochopaga]|nr:hypothetical protein ABW21_db0206814 [Drechslerella brochopaga]
MSYHRRPHYDPYETAAGRLPYDDERSAYETGSEHEPSRLKGRRDGSYSPRGRDHHAYHDEHSSRHDSGDRRTGDIRRSPAYRRLDRSRSPYYQPDESGPYGSHSRSLSPDSRHYRQSPPSNREYERYGRRQYYDRDAPDFQAPERAAFYGLPSRDVMLEGIGGDLTDHDVATLLPFVV